MMRHVSRIHRVELDWLFDRINLGHIQIKYVDTKNQLADMVTKGSFALERIESITASLPRRARLHCLVSLKKQGIAGYFVQAPSTLPEERFHVAGLSGICNLCSPAPMKECEISAPGMSAEFFCHLLASTMSTIKRIRQENPHVIASANVCEACLSHSALSLMTERLFPAGQCVFGAPWRQ